MRDKGGACAQTSRLLAPSLVGLGRWRFGVRAEHWVHARTLAAQVLRWGFCASSALILCSFGVMIIKCATVWAGLARQCT